MSTQTLESLSQEQFISLTTYRRDGQAVATPVGFVIEGDHLLVYTEGHTGKVKRICHQLRVTVASSTFSGEVTGPVWSATAVIQPNREEAYALFVRKYGEKALEGPPRIIVQITLD